MNQTFYESMKEYTADAVIGHYRQSTEQIDPNPVLIVGFHVVSDPDVNVDLNDVIVKDDIEYVSINWGESEDSYIRVSELWVVSYIRYELGSTDYISDGTVYETAESALNGRLS